MLRKKLRSRLLILVILPLLFLSGCAAADMEIKPDNSAEILISGERQYKALRLNSDIYNAANPDLSDLILVDSHGETVPYFLNSSVSQTIAAQEIYGLSLINSYIKDDHFYFDYSISQDMNSDIIATSLEFTTDSSNFAKTVQLYGSYDNKNWDFLQNDKIYAIDNTKKLYIEFSIPQKYTHYRLQLANNLEQIAFLDARLVFDAEINEENYFIESLSPQFSIEEQNKATCVILSGLKNLRLCDITIQTNSIFKRTVSAPGGFIKELYNLSINNLPIADLSMPQNGQIALEDTYTLTIDNADDKPISINGIVARYYADELVFEAKAHEVYRLIFGADTNKKAQVYDIGRYKNEILKGSLDQVKLGSIVYAADIDIPAARNYRPIFNIIVLVIALILGLIIISRLKRQQ